MFAKYLKWTIVASVAIAACLLSMFGVFQTIRQSPSSSGRLTTIPALDLPRCDSSEVVSLLDRVIRSTPRGSSIQSIDGHQELSFDREANQRTGQCITHTDDGEVEVKFIVEWLERDKGQFAVRIPAPDLPRCDSSEVVSLLDRVIRSTPRGSSIQSIDGHQELSFDREANQRTGQCITHTDDGEVEVKFIVEWLERDKGQFAVRLIR